MTLVPQQPTLVAQKSSLAMALGLALALARQRGTVKQSVPPDGLGTLTKVCLVLPGDAGGEF